MSNIQDNCCLHETFEKWTNIQKAKHQTRRRKDSRLQSLKLPVEYHSWEYKFDIKNKLW